MDHDESLPFAALIQYLLIRELDLCPSGVRERFSSAEDNNSHDPILLRGIVKLGLLLLSHLEWPELN